MNMRSSALVPVFVSLSLAAIGCGSTRYGYRPTAMAVSSEAGFPASHYVVPPEKPAGEAFVTSFGTRAIGSGEPADTQLIHVRLAVANQAGEARWSIDPGQLTLTSTGGKMAPPRSRAGNGRCWTCTTGFREARPTLGPFPPSILHGR